MQKTIISLPKVAWLTAILLYLFYAPAAYGFDYIKDTAAIGAAFMTHLTFHEIGHQVVASEVGADSAQMRFFTMKDGKFYPGLSTHENVPEDSSLPYAIGGEYMAGHTFEVALRSYRQKPTT